MTDTRRSVPEFDALAALLERSAGLTFDGGRRDSLAYSVGERMAHLGLHKVGDYVQLMHSVTGAAERQALIDAVTIPETHFLRNPPQVRALRRWVLPELVRAAAARPDKRIVIWSAGCSTGEEPYGTAMVLRELIPKRSGVRAQIIATDVSTRALAAAEAATYSERSLHLVDSAERARWFVRERREPQRYRVRDDVRSMVEFRHHNLVTDPPVVEPGSADLILCRNVTIYFSRQTTRVLVGRLHGCLRDGGYLFLGHAETLWQVTDAFTLVSLGDAFVYRRLDEASERRTVLPDRRTSDEPYVGFDRRGSRVRRRTPSSVRASSPEPRPDPLDVVRAALRDGRYDEAADLAEEVTESEPLSAVAHHLHGVALSDLGRFAEASAALRRAIFLDPGDGIAQFLLGGALERLGEWGPAAQAYLAAAATLQTTAPAHLADALDGRSPAELAELCRTLADAAARRRTPSSP